MRLFLLIAVTLSLHSARAQKIDSIYVHLYTDSLKKGTYNYINIDGKLPNGRFLPLDSSHLSFHSSAGTFYGNSLFLPADFAADKVHIRVALKHSGVSREFDMYVKKATDNTPLPTEEDVLRSRKRKTSTRGN